MQNEPIIPELSIVDAFMTSDNVINDNVLRAIERDIRKQEIQDIVQQISDQHQDLFDPTYQLNVNRASAILQLLKGWKFSASTWSLKFINEFSNVSIAFKLTGKDEWPADQLESLENKLRASYDAQIFSTADVFARLDINEKKLFNSLLKEGYFEFTLVRERIKGEYRNGAEQVLKFRFYMKSKNWWFSATMKDKKTKGFSVSGNVDTLVRHIPEVLEFSDLNKDKITAKCPNVLFLFRFSSKFSPKPLDFIMTPAL